MNYAKAVAVLMAVISCITIPAASGQASADPAADGDYLLVDFGNGDYEWREIPSPGTTVSRVLEQVLADRYVVTDGFLTSVDGFSQYVLANGQVCRWYLYMWDVDDWLGQACDVSVLYGGGCIAIGFHTSAGNVPGVTPDNPDSWTQSKFGSSAGSVSPASPLSSLSAGVLWDYQVPTGGIYSNILCADGYIYFTTGGSQQSVGKNQSSHTYCIDVENRTVVWSFTNRNTTGYETSTPCIVGNMIIVTSANWHVYCLDRYTGEPLAELLPDGYVPNTSCANIAYYGKTGSDKGESGAMTAVYDSGALYFHTSDGTVRCYTVDRAEGFSEVWSYSMGPGHRFYYYSPVVVRVGGHAYVASGDTGGNIVFNDAVTGEPLSAPMRVDPLTDGAVSAIADCGNGTVMVNIATSTGGSVSIIDVLTGEVLVRKVMLAGNPVITGGIAYLYASNGEDLVMKATGETVRVRSGLYALDPVTLECIWASNFGAVIKAAVSYCGGFLYTMDYSPRSLWPDGGCVRCFDANTGALVWRTVLDDNPQYSMVAATTAGGMVFTANDSGTVYILRDMGGVPEDNSLEHTNKLLEPDWITVYVIVLLGALTTIVIYRRI